MRQVLIASLASLLAGSALTYYFMPSKTVIQTTEHETVKVQKDVVTVTKEVTKPDGTKEIDSTVTDHSTEKQTQTASTTVSIPPSKLWRISGGYGLSALDSPATYSVELSHKFIGALDLGLRVEKGPQDSIGSVIIGWSF